MGVERVAILGEAAGATEPESSAALSPAALAFFLPPATAPDSDLPSCTMARPGNTTQIPLGMIW